MGRRPNALILEFFERGPKLEDSSNRYQHTCKNCGEKFPKGRIDSLTAHIVKKCPAISLRDRQKALLQLNDLPDLPESRNAGSSQVELPVGNRNWTALETLAEVSRQIDLSEKQDDRVPDEPTKTEARIDPFELQEQWTPENPPMSYDTRAQREKKGNSRKGDPTQSVDNFAGETTSPNEMMAMAAVAQARFAPSMLDPALMGEGMPELQPDMHLEAEQALNQFLAARPVNEKGWNQIENAGQAMYPEPENFLASSRSTFPVMAPGLTTEFRADNGNGQKSVKPKVRGRFTPGRRKEVLEVRKRGACIRCRMLKKPCSGETPCATCKNVESARLWKQPCIRSRIADELDIYSAGLHKVLAFHQVGAIKSRVNFVTSPSFIVATHYPETAVFASFRGLIGQEEPSAKNMDPSINVLGMGYMNNGIIHKILDNENDDQSVVMDAYIRQMSPVFYDKEPSRFMHITLGVALELSRAKGDQLLAHVLELWSTVHILVDHEATWALFEKASLESAAESGTPIDDMNHQVLTIQLNAVVEKKAGVISKSVLNDLERRLLLRTPEKTFETFLVTIILLNCVEKSTWLFKSWEQDFLQPRWPLDKTPVWYGSQGERISDMLQMILRMRGIPPNTTVQHETGMLVTEDAVAKDYFEKIQLGYVEVKEKQSNPVFDPADSRCYELRFCSKLLLPTS